MKLEERLHHVIALAIFAFGVSYLVLSCAGCGVIASAAPKVSEETYRAEQLLCVDRNETRALIDACRDDVRARYGRLDAGARKEVRPIDSSY